MEKEYPVPIALQILKEQKETEELKRKTHPLQCAAELGFLALRAFYLQRIKSKEPIALVVDGETEYFSWEADSWVLRFQGHRCRTVSEDWVMLSVGRAEMFGDPRK